MLDSASASAVIITHRLRHTQRRHASWWFNLTDSAPVLEPGPRLMLVEDALARCGRTRPVRTHLPNEGRNDGTLSRRCLERTLP